MGDFTPPPLFPPVSAGGDTMDTGDIIITHGEVPYPVVDQEIASWNIHLSVDLDPDTMSTQNLPHPDHEPQVWVRLGLSPSNADGSLIISSEVTGRQINERQFGLRSNSGGTCIRPKRRYHGRQRTSADSMLMALQLSHRPTFRPNRASTGSSPPTKQNGRGAT